MNKIFFQSVLIASTMLALGAPVLAQQNKSAANNQRSMIQVTNGSFFYKVQGNALAQQDVAAQLISMLGLNAQHTFTKVSEKTDKLGFVQSRFQQYYNGVLVDGGSVLVHSKGGLVQSLNGRVASLGNFTTTPGIRKTDAEDYAKSALLVRKTIKNYPVELVIVSGNSGDQQDYALAYKVRVDALSSEGKVLMQQVYVDAATGKIFKQLNLIKNVDVTATAQTLYSGARTITTDSVAAGYRLHDNIRKIITYDAGGADMPDTGSVYFSNPRDYFNATTIWDGAPALMEMKLTNVTNNMLTGLGFGSGLFVTSVVMKDFGAGLTLAGWPNIDFSPGTTATLPIVAKNLYVFPKDTTYVGGFGKVDLFGGTTYNVTDSAYFNVSQITAGVYNWSDISGNAGTYTISKENNPALDAHWGMEMTHDFYNTVLNRNSYDDQGSQVVNYVNGNWPGSGTQDNAAALPSPYFSMVYGLGDGDQYDAFVGLDVMGHEFTHMVTESNGNGGLDYQGESGALNESFSDIFGTSIEFFTKGNDANWTIGEDLAYDGTPLRSMSSPKLFQNPDTYLGQYWVNTSSNNDDGGVHENSGVQNKWYYLLVEGGSGTNDNGDAYTVTGIGIEKAEKITYRSLTTYLTPGSQFIDACNGSLQATLDLYGNDSTAQEFKSVKDAWFAVGIGKTTPVTAINTIQVGNNDLQLYPNPATDRLMISSSLNQHMDAEIMNEIGIPVMKVTISKGLNSLDVSGLAKGIYMIRYNTGAKGFVQKFTVL